MEREREIDGGRVNTYKNTLKENENLTGNNKCSSCSCRPHTRSSVYYHARALVMLCSLLYFRGEHYIK